MFREMYPVLRLNLKTNEQTNKNSKVLNVFKNFMLQVKKIEAQ